MIGTKKAIKQPAGVKLLADIPFKLDIASVMRRMLFWGSSPGFEKEARELVFAVMDAARPRAVYKVSQIGGKTCGSIEIDGIRFSSHLLRINLEKAEKVFSYAVTCGCDLDGIRVPEKNGAGKYCLETLKTLILAQAVDYLRDYLSGHYHLDYLFSLSPGEYQAWPLKNQKTVFALLGDVEKLIGVTLSADGTAIPVNSTSGLFFHAETKFENCQLCSREPCMMRRAPFSLELVHRLKQTPHTLCARQDNLVT
jgi:hypothetical protein